MKHRSVWLLILALSFSACGGIKRIAKQPVPPENVVRSYRLTAEADKLMEEGKDHLALLKYLEAADLNPYHEVIYNKVGIAYSKLAQYTQARRAVERSIGLNAKYAFAYNTLGIIRLAEQDPKGAVDSFKRAISLTPDVASFHVNLGQAYMDRQKFDDAREAYRRALELDKNAFSRRDVVELSFPGDEKQDPERHYQMARFFAEIGDKASCLRFLSKALAAGFVDFKRLSGDQVFDRFRDDTDFQNLLGSYPGALKKS